MNKYQRNQNRSFLSIGSIVIAVICLILLAFDKYRSDILPDTLMWIVTGVAFFCIVVINIVAWSGSKRRR